MIFLSCSLHDSIMVIDCRIGKSSNRDTTLAINGAVCTAVDDRVTWCNETRYSWTGYSSWLSSIINKQTILNIEMTQFFKISHLKSKPLKRSNTKINNKSKHKKNTKINRIINVNFFFTYTIIKTRLVRVLTYGNRLLCSIRGCNHKILVQISNKKISRGFNTMKRLTDNIFVTQIKTFEIA